MKNLARIIVAFVCAASASLAGAQAGAPRAAYSDEELKTFAAAAIEVLRIKADYRARLTATENPGEIRQTEEAANRAIVAAVERRGLSPDRYREILAYADTSPEVAAKVRQYMESSVSEVPDGNPPR